MTYSPTYPKKQGNKKSNGVGGFGECDWTKIEKAGGGNIAGRGGGVFRLYRLSYIGYRGYLPDIWLCKMVTFHNSTSKR